MAAIKSYTDLEQSKKLEEILPTESADMQYISFRHRDETIEWIPQLGTPSKYDIPCWSLVALLSILPQSITKYIESERCQKTFHLNLFRSYYHCVSYSFTPSVDEDNTLYCIGGDNWVDACCKMILKLKELNLL